MKVMEEKGKSLCILEICETYFQLLYYITLLYSDITVIQVEKNSNLRNTLICLETLEIGLHSKYIMFDLRKNYEH